MQIYFPTYDNIKCSINHLRSYFQDNSIGSWTNEGQQHQGHRVLTEHGLTIIS